jgi:FkbM family methyltransferase
MPALDKVRLIQHPFYGPVRVFGDEDTISRQVAGGGEWEANIAHLMAAAVVPGTDVLDIGANMGFSALGILKHGAKPRMVHCFEPQADVCAVLQHNVDGLPVMVYGFALSDRARSFAYLVEPTNIGGTQLTEPLHMKWHTLVTPLDAMLSTFDKNPVSVVKMDVEGHEDAVLHGGAEFFKKHRPTLFIEIFPDNVKAITEQLRVDLKYEVVEHLGGWDYLAKPVEKWVAEPKPVEWSLPEYKGIFKPEPQYGLLGLVMIVKNEAHGIEKTLNSILPYVELVTILDTGSTDGTKEVIHRVLREHGHVTGVVYEEPFVDFATSRNRALELHGERTTFTFMPDADDVLEGDLTFFRAGLTYQATLGTKAIKVNIRRGDLAYQLPLILRTSEKYRYKGRVHEYVEVPTPEIALGGAVLTQSPPPQSAEASKKRWERDAKLLEEDLAVNPMDPRTLFYLAQTYECLGNKNNASAFYRRRILTDGWADETFEARLRLGKMLLHDNNPEGIEVLLAAHAMAQRAEPLLALAQHYHEKDNHALAYLFASRIPSLPLPNTTLFVDHDAYQKACDLIGIHAFYLGPSVRYEGFKAAERAVQGRPTDERLRANRAFYARSAAETFGGLTGVTTQQIPFTPRQGWNALNPSIHYDGEVWRCIIRSTNYQLADGKYTTSDGGPIKTENNLLVLEKDLKPSASFQMRDLAQIKKTAYPVQGYEDCRLFQCQGDLFATATVCDFTEDGRREIAVLYLKSNGDILKAYPVRGSWSDRPQKNWMPIDGTMDALYSVEQGTYVGLRSSYLDPGLTLPHGRLRGGSQVIKVPFGAKEYLCIVHDVTWGGGKRTYLHRFCLLDDKLKLMAMSDPFYFNKPGIEFCAGLAVDGDRLVASYGVDDKEAWLATFSLKKVLAALRTDYVI